MTEIGILRNTIRELLADPILVMSGCVSLALVGLVLCALISIIVVWRLH